MNLEDNRGLHLQQLFYKTRPCRHFRHGVCWLGSKCCFAHGGQDIRERPNVTKTRLCKKWLAGICHKTEKQCWFAHGFDDMAEGPWKPQSNHHYSKKMDASQAACPVPSSSGACTGVLYSRTCLGQIEDDLCTSSNVTVFEPPNHALTCVLYSQTCLGQIEDDLCTSSSVEVFEAAPRRQSGVFPHPST